MRGFLDLGIFLTPSYLKSSRARSDQFDGRGVDNADRALEAPGQPESGSMSKTWPKGLQMLQDAPEQFFGHGCVPNFVCVRQVVPARGSGAAHRRQWSRMQPQGVTDVIEAQGVGQLRKKQTDHMAPRTKRAGLIFNTRFSRQLRNQMVRNPFAKLCENRDFRLAWLRSGLLFFHPCRVAGKITSAKPFFISGYGMALFSNQSSVVNRARLGRKKDQPQRTQGTQRGRPPDA